MGGGGGGGGVRRLRLTTGLRHQQLAVGVPPGNLPPPTCFTWSSPFFFISIHIVLLLDLHRQIISALFVPPLTN